MIRKPFTEATSRRVPLGNDKSIAILCSGFGLGFYLPGLFLRDRLIADGHEVKSYVYEELLTADGIDRIDKNRLLCSKSFSFAKAAQKVPGSLEGALADSALRAMLREWEVHRVTRFIVLSGHWIPIIDRYKEATNLSSLDINLLFVDALPTTSWAQISRSNPRFADQAKCWELYDKRCRTINMQIIPKIEKPIPWSDRRPELIVHGGGWEIGTYREHWDDLDTTGFNVSVVGSVGMQDQVPALLGARWYVDDPLWRPWHRKADGTNSYPPFSAGYVGEPPRFTVPEDCHGLHSAIRNASAVVSKPGAGTLIDSLGAATPVLFLPPFGAYEAANAAIWIENGFGADLSEWLATTNRASKLEEMHRRLVTARSVIPDIIKCLSNHFRKDC